MIAERVILSIRVPKEIEPGPGPIVAEQIFSAIHSIQDDFPWYKRLFGLRGSRISFEISHTKRHIRFLVNCERRYKNLIEGQIYAHYPNVEIFEEEDYIQEKVESLEVKSPLSSAQGEGASQELVPNTSVGPKVANSGKFQNVPSARTILATELYMVDPVIFPIKRYPQFEDKLTRLAADPMAGITSAICKLNHPNDEVWRVKYTEILRIVNRGLFGSIENLQHMYINVLATRKVWPRVVFFPLYFFFWFRRKTSGFKGGSLTMGVAGGGGGGGGDDLEEGLSKTHDRENTMQACIDKIGKLLFEANIRIGYVTDNGDIPNAKLKIKEITGTFKQFNQPLLNELDGKKIEMGHHLLARFKDRIFDENSMILNVEELATLYHAPSSVVQTPNIDWVKSRKLEAPINLPSEETIDSDNLTLLGKTNYRGMHQVFGIKRDSDRRRHMYIIGKTGMGKTTLLENMIFSDIEAGKGIGVIDPHGDLAERVVDFVPPHRTNDVIIFDPSDVDNPVAFNMLESADPSYNSVVCSGLVGIFKKIYAESWGPRLEHILRNTILALLSYPGASMLGIIRILQDEKFRAQVIEKVEDPVVRGFWENEFNQMTDKLRVEAISPIQNKVGQFLSSPIIRNIVGQPKSSIDLRFAMDKGKIVIVNLSKGKIGEDNSSLLGAMMITKFQLDAMSRADTPEKDRKDFFLYVDEFQNFATESFATILSEARKYRLNLTMANQYIAQMPEEVRDAVFGNVGTTIAFQVGYDDAEYLSQQFEEIVMPNDLVSLNKYTIYTKLLIDGMPSRPFSADTLPPPEGSLVVEEGRREKIIKVSRERYSQPRELVEDKIKRWSQSMEIKKIAPPSYGPPRGGPRR